MEICNCITNVWTITVNESEVLERFIDESIQESERRDAAGAPAIIASDDDKAILHRYYCAALAELSALLAKRTKRVGGDITNTVDETTKMITTVYMLAMTCNHEPELLPSLGAHCLDFLVARLMERWYGQGSDFGGDVEKDQIRHILQFRRFPIERPIRPL